MTLSEALAILGLSEGADEASVKAAYRRLSLQTHPDKSGGDTQEQAQINTAYDVAMAAIRLPNAVVLRTTKSLQQVELALLAERYATQAESAAKAINHRRRRRFDTFRNISLLVAFAAGVLLLSADYLLEPLSETMPEDVKRSLKLLLGMFVVTWGAVALWLQMQVQRIENAIQNLHG